MTLALPVVLAWFRTAVILVLASVLALILAELALNLVLG
jgi:hypothetical protein